MTTKYKLVPIEPTEEMVNAMFDYWKKPPQSLYDAFIGGYKAMLEAQESEPVAYITIPKNADEAEAMQKLGFAWLKENAPVRLTNPPADKEKDKRIAELTEQNKELVEALKKHGRHLADCAFLPNWIDAECNCGLFEALAKVKASNEL